MLIAIADFLALASLGVLLWVLVVFSRHYHALLADRPRLLQKTMRLEIATAIFLLIWMSRTGMDIAIRGMGARISGSILDILEFFAAVSVVWMAAEGIPFFLELSGVVWDDHAARRRLQQKERLFAALVHENSVTPILVFDSKTGRITYRNGKADIEFGSQPDFLRDLTQFSCDDASVFCWESEPYPAVRVWQVYKFPLSENRCGIQAFEVSESRKAAQALESANQKLEQFAYSASHDLQQPLRTISAFAELLAERLAALNLEDSEAQSHVRRVLDASERMSRLISDLLQYSRVGRAQLRVSPVDLGEIWQAVKADYEHDLNRLNALVRSQVDLPLVRADRTQMHQLLANALSNSLKYAAPDRRPDIMLSARVQGDYVYVEISDNGIGVPAKHQDLIFKIFHRLHTSDEVPGTGVGLAIARQIVEKHGGIIGLRNNDTGGATLWFTLPKNPA